MKFHRPLRLTALAAFTGLVLGCGSSSTPAPTLAPTGPVFSILRANLFGTDQQANGPSTSGESLSSNGRFLVFSSSATNLVDNDTNGFQDCFVRDTFTGVTSRVSLDSSNAQGDGDSTTPRISADGRFVVFTSSATNLVAGDTNAMPDVFLRDLTNGVTTRISVDSAEAEANGGSSAISISSDGRFVAFFSTATNLVPGDNNGFIDVFLRDTLNGTTTRVSLDSQGNEGNGDSFAGVASDDGRFVAFYSEASNLVAGDANNASDIFLKDLQDGSIQLVSVSSTNQQSNGGCSPSIDMTFDGRFVSFTGAGTNLVPDDNNGLADVFVRDVVGQTTVRASLTNEGAETTDIGSFAPKISANGRYVVFSSGSDQLVLEDTNGVEDIFLRDLLGATTARLNVSQDGVQANGLSEHPGISADGRFVMFGSEATNLVPNDTNGVRDIFQSRNPAEP
ncbi:MAG: PD40 domain-containing protein [Candidatus Eremiobacteraeota bacterium]|nr:PD40 domain-containing protein [Candidatus Eremiobacteraeota bacterium]